VRADTAAGPAVDGVGAAGDRGAAAGARPGWIAILQRLRPCAGPPRGCLSLAEVADPPGEVLVTGEPGQVGVRPVPVFDALGKHGLVHTLGRVAGTAVSHETNRPVAAPGPASPRQMAREACGAGGAG
jgi:hypothetical protein